MEFYLLLLIILVVTALSDLYVGVANDAVNFVTSAVGSKVGTRVAIMIVASIGVFLGTTFSSGMMEVARKGVFNPEMFVFHEVMIIFLAVMLTDIILLDLYNTFSLPTSTTVSLVFELIGGAVAMSWIKVQAVEGDFGDIFAYLNTGRIVTIVSSIGLSIVLAFIFGSLIQFISRLIFTFDFQKRFKRYGAIYSSMGIVTIVYFILVKGAKGSVLLSPDQAAWISNNMLALLATIFLGVAVIFQFMIMFTRINVLRIIVFAGTFALALAFAANDLVNFIGAPMGAINSYELAVESGGDPMSMTMVGLTHPVRANPIFLLVAGTIMVLTLWFSRKARSVTQTTVLLGRQVEGAERFTSSPLARSIVRMAIGLYDGYQRVVPITLRRKVSERIDPTKTVLQPAPDGTLPAFDMLRAAVNLIVASALISVGTSLKLPLSTTFVTFMVAMATSFADKSWGRESAVFRVNGVITVIGGWFFTAMLAFTACFAFTFAIYYWELPAILALVVIGFFFFYRTNKLHSKRAKEFEEKEAVYKKVETDGLSLNSKEVAVFLEKVSGIIGDCYTGLGRGNRRILKNAVYLGEKLSEEGEKIIVSILEVLKSSADEDKGMSPRYGRKIASLQIIVANLTSMLNGSYTYTNNNHTPPDEEQILEMKEVRTSVDRILRSCAHDLASGEYGNVSELKSSVDLLKKTIREYDRRQMKRIRLGKSKTRQSLMFIGTLNKAERIADQSLVLLNLYKETVYELSGKAGKREKAKPVSRTKKAAKKPARRSSRSRQGKATRKRRPPKRS